MIFKINNNTWEILEKSKEILLNKYNQESNDDATYAFGVCIYPDHEIWINKDMNTEQKIKTLKHELTHCFIWNYGLYNVPHFTEEMVCDIVSSINDFINEIVEKYKKVIDNG